MTLTKGQYVTVEFPCGSVIEGRVLHDVDDAYDARFRVRDGDEIITCKGWYAEDISVEPTL